MKPKKKRNRSAKHRNNAYIAIRDAYIETRYAEFLRTGIQSQMTITDFLVMHMNYPYQDAIEITNCYKKWERKLIGRR